MSFDSKKAPLPFIHDHRLSVLVKAPSELRSSEVRGKLSEHGNCWKPVPDRTAFLADVSVRLRVITVSAGAGKTVAAMQTQYLLQQVHSDHLCLLVKFSQLPETAEEIWGSNSEQSCLVRWFRETEATKNAPRREVARLIAQKIAGGKFTLIVEAFDQTTRGKNVHNQAGALRKFLEINATVRCVCTGRRYAIVDQFWHSLFFFDAWQFVQVVAFDETQSERFIGTERWNVCYRLSAAELVVPRSLEAIRDIALNELPGIRTASQIYWRSLLHTFEAARVTQDPDNFKSPDGTWEILKHHALQLFSLLAFECNRQGYLDGVRTAEELHAFLHEFLYRHTAFLKQQFAINSLPALEALLMRLARLNADIDFAAFDHEGIGQVIFQNRTLQDFFAAIWMCTHASDEDVEWFSENRFVRWKKSTETHYQMWKLATEMPADAKGQMTARIDKAYVKAVGVLYEPSIADKPAVRSTEMIWRSWPTLEEISRLKDLLGKPIEDAVVAQKALDEFVHEYQAILKEGSRGRTAQVICQDFETWFVNIHPTWTEWNDGEPDDDSNPLPNATNPFQLAKYPITNLIYKLFDADLSARYGAYATYDHDYKGVDLTRYAKEGWRPVVAIDWFDAWCVAIWLNGALPKVVDWNFACDLEATSRLAVAEDLQPGDLPGNEYRTGEASVHNSWFRRSA